MKKVLISLVSAAFLAACSADGQLSSGSNINNPSVIWSNPDDDYVAPPSGGNTIVNCSLGGVCQQLTQAACNLAGGTVVSSCPGGGNNLVYCLDMDCNCTQTQEYACIASGVVVSSCPSPTNISYCYYDSDCDLVPGKYTTTSSECINSKNGEMISRNECKNRGATCYNEPPQ